jgi:hypothetical protein
MCMGLHEMIVECKHIVYMYEINGRNQWTHDSISYCGNLVNDSNTNVFHVNMSIGYVVMCEISESESIPSDLCDKLSIV